jgi:cobalt-zinc-cadmium efflux system outer membrane protein
MRGAFSCAAAHRHVVWLIVLSLVGLGPGAQVLSLEDVYRRIDEHNPELAAARSAVVAAGHGVRQARVFPNPELEVGIENPGLSEVEASITQPLELFGRRTARSDLAVAHHRRTEQQRHVRALSLRAEALRRFAHALALRHTIAQVDSQRALTRAERQRIRRRVAVGAAMALDAERATMALEEIELRGHELAVEYANALRDVAVLWGDTGTTAWEPSGSLVSRFSPPSLAQVKRDVSSHPALRLHEREREVVRADIAATKVDRLPETALTGGYVRNNESGEGKVRLGLALSIPLFDRKQGAIARQTARMEALEHTVKGERLSRLAHIEQVHAAMVLLHEKMHTYRHTILPTSAHILESVTAYYEQGVVRILDVLEARASLIEKQIEAIELREQWAALAADLLELAGTEVEVVE